MKDVSARAVDDVESARPVIHRMPVRRESLARHVDSRWKRNARTRGAALIIAMLLAALAAAVIATLASSQSQWLRIVELRRDQVQAQALVLAGLAWARQVLQDDTAAGPYDHLGETWAIALPPTPLDNGSIEGRIVDAQGLVNLNNLAGDGAVARAEHRRLAKLFAQAQLPAVAIDALADWIDGDDAARDGSHEATPYAALRPARLPPNAPLLRPSEATLVRGVDAARFAALLPYVTALPATTPLNVNTAPREVLQATINGLDDASLTALLADRARKMFTTPAEFRSRLPAGASVDDLGAIGVRSDYFLVTVKARQRETVAQGRALLKRDGQSTPRVVWQTVE